MANPGAPILLDTGPLLTYLAVRFLEITNAPHRLRNAVLADVQEDFSERNREEITRAFHSRSLVTTPHVMTELLKFREHSQLARQRKSFLPFCLDFLAKDVQEIECPIVAVNEDDNIRTICHQHGLVDAALVLAATKRRCLLLTNDNRLRIRFEPGTVFQIRLLKEFLAHGD